MSTVQLSCQEIVELVTDYLEGSLSHKERKAFEEHLSGCPHCTNYLDQMRQTIQAAGRLSERTLPPGSKERLLSAFRDWKRGGGGRP